MALFSEDSAKDPFGFLGLKRQPPNTHNIHGTSGGSSVGNDIQSQTPSPKPDISDQPGLNQIRRHSIKSEGKSRGYLGDKLEQNKAQVYKSPGDPTSTSTNSNVGLALDQRRDVPDNWYAGGPSKEYDKKYDIEKKFDDVKLVPQHRRSPANAELGKAANDLLEFKKNYNSVLSRLDVKTEPGVLNNIKSSEVLTTLATGRSSAFGMENLMHPPQFVDGKWKKSENAKTDTYYEAMSQTYNKQYTNNSEHLDKKKIPDYSKDEQSLRIDGYNTKTVEPNNVTNQWKYRNEDLIPLYFHDLVNKKFIPFRSFINSLSEGSNATWSEVQYLGRADKVYIYSGFTRTMTIDFTCQAFSIEELHPMWQRINYLVGLTKPAGYTSDVSLSAMDSFIIPPFVKFRLGDMYRNQPVIITDVSTTVPTEASWELVSNEHGKENNYDYLNGSIVRNNSRSAQYPTMVTMGVSMTLLEKRAPQTIARHFGDSTVESVHDTEDNSLPRGDFNHQLTHYDVQKPIDPSLAELPNPNATNEAATDSDRKAPGEDALGTFNRLKSKYETLAE
tara:strand:+ start:60683 stop:62356 length:1674 start_codon:yes stop_codon:yes gene_type:complete